MLTTTTAIGLLSATLHGGLTPSVHSDPSLYVRSNHIVTVMAEEMPSTVLDYDGSYLTWDSGSREFTLYRNSVLVSDLETSLDSRGWPYFEGDFDGQGNPQVFGSVGLSSSATADYKVEISISSQLPAAYDVDNADDVTPIVAAAKECECSNGTDLSCKLSDCTDTNTCPNSTEGNTCEWKNVTVE